MSSLDIRLSKYNPVEPIEKVDRKGWIIYGDAGDGYRANLFPQYLNSLYLDSPTHNALCNSIATMIAGDGLISSNPQTNLEIVKLGINKEIPKLSLDLKIQGGCYLEVSWSLDRERIAKAKYLPYETVRLEENEDEPENCYYSYDWNDTQKYKPKKIALYNEERKDEEPVQVIFIKSFTPGNDYYPKPDYIGALSYVEIEKSIGIFHVNEVMNGFFPSTLIKWPKQSTPEEKARIKGQFQQKAQGAENAGHVFHLFADSKEELPEIESFAISDADKRYEFLSSECTNKIMIGHRVSNPSLFGVKTEGQLGGSTEIEVSAEMFDYQTINGYQELLLRGLEPIFGTDLDIGNNNPFLKEEANVDQSYTGIQISSAINVIAQANQGTLTTEQAKVIISNMLGFDADSVDKLFGVETKLSKGFTSEDERQWLDHLKDKGEVIGDEWELISEEDAGCHEDHAKKLSEAEATFKMFEEFADPEEKSEADSGLYKLRYAYSGETSSDSREFCVQMMQDANNGVVYRYEDITKLSDSNPQPGMGPNGSNHYDIFLYKGGVNCHHAWKRQIYFRKRVNGKFLPASKTASLENDKRVGNVPFVTPKGKEAVRPIDTPTKGRL